MINLNQSIAKVKAEIVPVDAPSDWVPTTHEVLIETIMHEGAGRDRKTLLKWLNEQVEAIPLGDEATIEIPPMEITKVEVEPPTADAGAKITVEGISKPAYRPEKRRDTIKTPKPRGKPVYRPVRRGNVWCLHDVNNGVMRQETFDVKGDARAYITRLEQDVDGLIEERRFHFARSG